MVPASVPGVADITLLRGARHPAHAPPRLLVEVPHGADTLAHYNALARELVGALPADLHHFFHVNTDVGAHDLGEATARAVLAARPTEAAVLVRCLVPRTFIDCNRVLDDTPTDAGEGRAAVTAGLPPYIDHPDDVALLRSRHDAYVQLTDGLFERVVASDGVALVPHTYAPRSVGIARVDRDIVAELHRVYAPDLADTWPLRAEVDLITRDADGVRLCPEGVVEPLLAALRAQDIDAQECHTYWLHPATRAAVLSARYPGRLLCFEVRRDCVVAAWTPFDEMHADSAKVDRFVGPLATALVAALG